MKPIALFILLFVQQALVAQSEDPLSARTKMRNLAGLVGSWNAVAREINSDGDSFDQSGTINCRWSPDSLKITCSLEWTVSNASGRYLRLPRERKFETTYSFNSKNNLYQVDDGTTSHKVAFDPRSNSLIRDNFFFLPVKREAMSSREVTKILNSHQIDVEFRLNSLESNFNELYTEQRTRR